MRMPGFPDGWNEECLAELAARYGAHSEEEAVAGDDTAPSGSCRTVVQVPTDLVPAVPMLIAHCSGVARLAASCRLTKDAP